MARSEHDHLVSSVLCTKLDEISQLNACFKSEKNQSEETMKLAAVLDPITSNFVYNPFLICHCTNVELNEIILTSLNEVEGM